LKGFYFETPKKILDFQETKDFINEIQTHCQKGINAISSLKPEEILEKAVLMHFYMLKPLADILGVSWKPSEECIERVRQGITEEDKKVFSVLMHLDLNLETIRSLFEYELNLPKAFHG